MKFKPNFIFYLGAGVLFFLFWILVVFPYDALQSRIITEIENQTGGRFKIDMAEMDVSLLGGVTFEKLQISEKMGGREEILLKSPKVEIDFSPFALLSKKVDVEFYLKGEKKGEIEGDFRQEPDEVELNLDFDDFPLSDLRFLTARTKINLQGKVNGEVNLKINPTDSNQNKGKIELQLVDLSVDPGTLSLDPSDPASALKIPTIKISGAKGSHIKARVEKDRLDIQSIVLNGGDLELNLGGKITMRGNNPGNYRLAMDGTFKVSKGLSDALPFLFILEKQKNAQGAYPLNLSGRLDKPDVRIGKFRVPL